MKIAIFSDAFYPINSGVVSYIVMITKGLSEMGHKVYLFLPKSKEASAYEKIFNKNVKIFQYRGVKAFFYPGFKFTSVFSLEDFQLFKKINPDIVFHQTPFTLGLKSITLAKFFDKPLVGVFHTRIAHKDNISNLGKVTQAMNLEKMAWRYLKFFYKDCDAVISPSRDIKKDLEKRKINKNVIVINNFVDTKELDSKKTNIKIKENSFVYLGRLSAEKNLPLLIKSFKKVVSKNKNTNLYLIGDGPAFDELKKLIKKNNLQHNVHMLGRLDRNIILKTDLMTKFLAIVTMSNTEVQPISLIEAMFKGLPILGPNTDGIRELIETKGNNVNGILVKNNSSGSMAKAMLKILGNAKLQKVMSKSALELSKNYDSKILIKKLEQESLRIIREHRKK